MAGELSSLLQHLEREKPVVAVERLKWIRAGLGNEVCLLPVGEVSYFQASEKYTSVVTANKEHLIRTPIRELMEQLDPGQFWQVHRATLVNIGHIECATRDAAGKVTLQLRSRMETLTVSRAFAYLFRQM